MSSTYPEGMADRLGASWTQRSPIGGEFRWVYTTEADPKQRDAYIRLMHTTESPIIITPERLAKIDEELDDGNINSGRLQLIGLNVHYFVRGLGD